MLQFGRKVADPVCSRFVTSRQKLSGLLKNRVIQLRIAQIADDLIFVLNQHFCADSARIGRKHSYQHAARATLKQGSDLFAVDLGLVCGFQRAIYSEVEFCQTSIKISIVPPHTIPSSLASSAVSAK